MTTHYILMFFAAVGLLAVLGTVILVWYATASRGDTQHPRVTVPTSYNELFHRRYETYGPLHDFEDDVIYAIGCAKLLGDEEAVQNLMNMYTDAIPRKTTP